MTHSATTAAARLSVAPMMDWTDPHRKRPYKAGILRHLIFFVAPIVARDSIHMGITLSVEANQQVF